MELISLKADFAAKELFAHEKVRKQFLSDTLGILDKAEPVLSGREEYHAVCRLRDGEGRDLTDLWELHIIELTKASRLEKAKVSRLEAALSSLPYWSRKEQYRMT